MKNAIDLQKMLNDNEKVEPEKIHLTHYLSGKKGWGEMNSPESTFVLQRADYVVKLGRCRQDGDMFAIYSRGFISIYKGQYNSGKY